MAVSTISIRRTTKTILERAKKTYEARIGKTTTWDEFLLELASRFMGEGNLVDSEHSLLELDDNEARVLLKLVEEGRRSWLKRVLAPMY